MTFLDRSPAIRSQRPVRGYDMAQAQTPLSNPPNPPKPSSGRTTFVCGDCKTASPLDSYISIDASHIQCPVCLYIFFREKGRPGAR